MKLFIIGYDIQYVFSRIELSDKYYFIIAN